MPVNGVGTSGIAPGAPAGPCRQAAIGLRWRPWKTLPSRSAATASHPRRGRKSAARIAAARASSRHPELFALTIAHVDCDAFYAAVEKRDNPALADRPVIVGGGRRGVVSAACYVARTYGVRSAMPMFKALKACPEAVVIPPDMAKYASVGREVRELMLALTPAVEPLSIDEAFLDLSGTERLHGAPPAVTLARFQTRVEREIGVTVSIGLSHNKFLAKIASDLDKPRGFCGDRPRRDALLPRRAARLGHLGRRQGDAGAARRATA